MNGGLKLDDRDLRILAILQQEGRITKTELAERVNLSPTPCWSRLKRLEKIGLIEGYRAKIALKRFGLTMVFMEADPRSALRGLRDRGAELAGRAGNRDVGQDDHDVRYGHWR